MLSLFINLNCEPKEGGGGAQWKTKVALKYTNHLHIERSMPNDSYWAEGSERIKS